MRLTSKVILSCVAVTFWLTPGGTVAQDDFFKMTQGDGTYQTREEMQADQAIVRTLFKSGLKALEEGRYETAREQCGNLNAHFFKSPFMEEQINIDANQSSHECFADARLKLGDVEGACRVYSQWGYTSLLSDVDPRRVCSDLERSRPAPAAATAYVGDVGKSPAAYGLLEALSNLQMARSALIAAKPAQLAGVIRGYRGACQSTYRYIPQFGPLVAGTGDLCSGDAFVAEGNLAAGCSLYRKALGKFAQAEAPLDFLKPHDSSARTQLSEAMSRHCGQL